MRPLDELLSDDPAWPGVDGWISQAGNPVEVLERDPARAEATLLAIQVTTRSPMGAVAYETGGLLVDRGWLRILGGGGPRLASLADWNGLSGLAVVEPLEGAMVVAHDAVGGLFALNGGRFEGEPGGTHYFGPDGLRWEDLRVGYSDFLWWALSGDVSGFYAALRWPGWEDDAAAIAPDEGFSLYPPPFTAEGRPIERASRRPVPMTELWDFYRRSAAGLGGG